MCVPTPQRSLDEGRSAAKAHFSKRRSFAAPPRNSHPTLPRVLVHLLLSGHVLLRRARGCPEPWCELSTGVTHRTVGTYTNHPILILLPVQETKTSAVSPDFSVLTLTTQLIHGKLITLTIRRAHVSTPVTCSQRVCRLLLGKKKKII